MSIRTTGDHCVCCVLNSSVNCARLWVYSCGLATPTPLREFCVERRGSKEKRLVWCSGELGWGTGTAENSGCVQFELCVQWLFGVCWYSLLWQLIKRLSLGYLRALVLVEVMGLTTHDSSSRGSVALFWPFFVCTRPACGIQTYMQACSQTHKINE